MKVVPDLRMLTEGIIVRDNKTYPVLDIEMIATEDQKLENLKFEWKALEMTKSSFRFQVIFETAIFVSSSGEPDSIKVTFFDPYMFVGENNLAISERDKDRRVLSSDDTVPSNQASEGEVIVIVKELPQ